MHQRDACHAPAVPVSRYGPHDGVFSVLPSQCHRSEKFSVLFVELNKAAEKMKWPFTQ